MNTRTAAPVAITVSLVILMSGCAGVAAQNGQALVNGRVAAADRFEQAVEQAAQSDAARAASAEARRELRASRSVSEPEPFSADVRRELHSVQPAGVPVAVNDNLSPLGNGAWVLNEPAEQVNDNLSPLGGSR